MLTTLLTAIARTAALTPAEIVLCTRYFEPLALKKSTVLSPAGSVPQHLYFVDKGFVRLYYLSENGDEATTHLGAPGDFLTSFLSFIHERPAPESLASLTEGRALRISRPHLAALIGASETFKVFSLGIFERAITAAQARADGLATRSAEQRYRHLLAARPDLALHVPVRHLASYLGITPESLSRIRRQVVS